MRLKTGKPFSPSIFNFRVFPSEKKRIIIYRIIYIYIYILKEYIYIYIYIYILYINKNYIFIYIKHFATKMVSEAKTVKEDR